MTMAPLLGRVAPIEFALAAIIKRMPDDARQEVQRDLNLFVERSNISHASGDAVAEAGQDILRESGVQLA